MKKINIGDVLMIPFNNTECIYARVLTDASYAFYDCKDFINKPKTDINEIINKPILFIIAVHKKAINSKRWKKVGNIELEDKLKRNPPRFFVEHDPKGVPIMYNISDNGETRYNVDKQECIGLEVNFIWSPERVEERIRNHYDGVDNLQANMWKVE